MLRTAYNLCAIIMVVFISSVTNIAAAVNVNFSGKLIIPDCTINNGNNINVDFDEIEIQTLPEPNKGYHSKLVNIPVNCPYSLGKPKIRLIGNTGTMPNSLATSKFAQEKLVIYFQNSNGNNINLNQYQDIYANDIQKTGGNTYTITMKASLGHEGGVELLTAGDFNALVNIEVRYE